MRKRKNGCYLTCNNGLSIWSDFHSMAGEVGHTQSEQLLACLGVPHPDIITTAGGKQLSRIPERKIKSKRTFGRQETFGSC